MFFTEHHSLALPFLVPPSKPRRSGCSDSRIVDDPAAVRRALKRMENAKKRSAKHAAATLAAPVRER